MPEITRVYNDRTGIEKGKPKHKEKSLLYQPQFCSISQTKYDAPNVQVKLMDKDALLNIKVQKNNNFSKQFLKVIFFLGIKNMNNLKNPFYYKYFVEWKDSMDVKGSSWEPSMPRSFIECTL